VVRETVPMQRPQLVDAAQPVRKPWKVPSFLIHEMRMAGFIALPLQSDHGQRAIPRAAQL